MLILFIFHLLKKFCLIIPTYVFQRIMIGVDTVKSYHTRVACRCLREVASQLLTMLLPGPGLPKTEQNYREWHQEYLILQSNIIALAFCVHAMLIIMDHKHFDVILLTVSSAIMNIFLYPHKFTPT